MNKDTILQVVFNNKELEPIAVCTISKLNTGEQEWPGRPCYSICMHARVECSCYKCCITFLTQCRLCDLFCLTACLPATVLHDLLTNGQISSILIMWSSETIPQGAHTSTELRLRVTI